MCINKDYKIEEYRKKEKNIFEKYNTYNNKIIFLSLTYILSMLLVFNEGN